MRLPRQQQQTVRRTAWICALFLISIVPTGVSTAAGQSGTAALFPTRAVHAFDHRAELRKVLSVVEHRTKDGKVLDKMREKLAAMSDRELRLAASLCERIARDDESAGSDIAFSIVMALVVLS